MQKRPLSLARGLTHPRNSVARLAAFLVLCAPCAALADPPKPESKDPFREKIQLIPREMGEQHMHSHGLRAIEDAALLAKAKQGSFSKWKTHEDDCISFAYPDDPDIKLTVKFPEDRVAFPGGRVGTTEDTFHKAYQLTLGGKIYGLILIDKAEAFDNGFCLCGAVVYRKYLIHHDALCRFDFLERGQAKKIQMLGGGLRAVFMEWTHLPVHQDVYVKMAESLRLKGDAKVPGQTPAQLRAALMKKMTVAEKIGFLERGMTRQAVEELLGAPTSQEQEVLVYRHQEGREVTTVRVPMKQGIFVGFWKSDAPTVKVSMRKQEQSLFEELEKSRESWITNETLPAERGSVDWVTEMIPGDAIFEEDSPRVIPKEDVLLAFDSFCKWAPQVKGEDWNRLCRAMSRLTEAKHTDPRILPLVRGRFLEMELPQEAAIYLLDAQDHAGSQDLFLKRFKIELASAKTSKETGSYLFSPFPVYPLLSVLDADVAGRKGLIVEAMDHANPSVRSSGYEFWTELSPGDALLRLRRGLQDEDGEVRKKAAAGLAKMVPKDEALALLQDRLKVESGEWVKKEILEIIAELTKKPGESETPQDGIDGQ